MSDSKQSIPMTGEEKNAQIRTEARATVWLFVICVVWHVGFGLGLSGTGIRVAGLPLWWLLSTPGVFVVALIGVIYLLRHVFVDFELGEEEKGNE